MATPYAPAKQDNSLSNATLIFFGILSATIILVPGYMSMAAQAEANAAEGSAFYAQCQDELANATYGRIGAWDIDLVCFKASRGRPTLSDHATVIKAAMLPEADERYIETQYLNQTRRHAPESWNPLGIPMYFK